MSNSSRERILDWVLQLQTWAINGSLLDAAVLSLGLSTNEQTDQLLAIVKRLSSGETVDIPPIVHLPDKVIPGAAGAYAGETGTIYINQKWQRNATSHQFKRVLTAEFGHHLDQIINTSDTPGDEGKRFADYLTEGEAERSNLAVSSESDDGLIYINNNWIKAELESWTANSGGDDYPEGDDDNTGADSLTGGSGDDTIDGGDLNDTVFGSDGNDSILGGNGDDSLRGDSGQDILKGENGNDTLIGGNDGDRIRGGEGDDYIGGSKGPDSLFGERGNDTIHGSESYDWIKCGEGNDSAFGGDWQDWLYGEDGDDYLDGGSDKDEIYGGNGDDTILGKNGKDSIQGGNGNDSITGDGGNDLIQGGVDGTSNNDQDTIDGGPGEDTIYGYSKADPMGGNSEDTLMGGRGNDSIYADRRDDLIIGGLHNDSIHGHLGHDIIWGDNENEDNGDSDGDDSIYGGQQNDTIYGGGGQDLIEGGSNEDEIYGGSGNDTLHGRSGYDTIYGGDGDDSVIGGSSSDRLFGEAGNDSLYASGGTGNDTLDGGDGNDYLDGGSGDVKSTLIGGPGNDTLFGNNGDDTARFSGNRGDYTLNFSSESSTIGGLSITVTGIDGDDRVSTVDKLEFDDVVVTESVSPIVESVETSTDGSKIIIEYDENLASETADASNFTAKVDGVESAITAVRATESTIEIELQETIKNDQTATIQYEQPTLSDDSNAIQDSQGNDADSLSTTTVTNRSKASGQPPTINIAIDDGGDGLLNNAEQSSVSIAGTTSGAEDGQTVTITISDGTNTVNTSALVSNDVYSVDSVDLTTLDDGTLNIQADVSDQAGNSATSATDSTVKDATAPSTTVLINDGGDGLLNALEDDSVSIAGSTTGVEDGQTVSIKISDGHSDLQTTATVNSNSYSATGLDLSTLNDGALQITADVSDRAGNQATQATDTTAKDSSDEASSGITITKIDDNGSPQLLIEERGTSSKFTVVLNAQPIHDVTVTLSGLDTSEATLSGPTLSEAKTLQFTSGNWNNPQTITVTGVDDDRVDGDITTILTATASNGYTGEATLTIKNIDDDVLPTITVGVDDGGDGHLNATEDESVTVAGSTSGVEDGQIVAIALTDGTNTVNTTATVATNAYSVSNLDLSTLGDGTLSIRADVSDQAGNTAIHATDSTKKDTTAPALTVAFNDGGDGQLNADEEGSVSIAGTTSGAEDGQNVSIAISDGTNTVNTTATVATNAYSVSNLDLSTLDDGTLSIRADVNDLAGNAAIQAIDSSEKDTTAPTLTVAINDGGDGLLNAQEDASISIAGTTSDTEDSQTVSIVISDGTDTINTTATVAANAYSVSNLDLSTLDDGTLSIRADVNDQAGNTAIQATDSTKKDTSPPTVALQASLYTLLAGQSAQVTFTLSEESTDFDLSDIDVVGGTLSNFSGSGQSYVVTFTPEEDSNKEGIVCIGNTAFSDSAGNFNQDGSHSDNIVTLSIDTIVSNDPPKANADTASVVEDGQITVNAPGVLSNDSDADASPVAIAVTHIEASSSLGARRIASGQTITSTYGSITLLADGSYIYSADQEGSNALGVGDSASDRYLYTITDGSDSDSAELSISITGVNDAPVIFDATSRRSYLEGSGLSMVIDTTLSGIDADHNSIASASVSISSGFIATEDRLSLGDTVGGVITSSWDPINGILSLTGATTNENYERALESVAYENTNLINPSTTERRIEWSVNDGIANSNSAVTIIDVGGVNDAPNALNDTAQVTAGGTETTSSITGLLSNDTDPENDSLAVTEVRTGPEHNAADSTQTSAGSTLVGSYGSLLLQPDGSFVYTADLEKSKTLPDGVSGFDHFTYTLSDGSDADQAQLSIEVIGQNDRPTANDDTAEVNENKLISKDTKSGVILSNDHDPDGEDLLINSFRTGLLTETGIEGSFATPLEGEFGTLQLNADGSYEYRADLDNVDSLDEGDKVNETFTYSLTDGKENDHGQLTIAIHGRNDAPTLKTPTSGLIQEVEGELTTTSQNLTGTLVGEDADKDAALSYAFASGSFTVGLNSRTGDYGKLSVDSNTGEYIYTPDQSSIVALDEGDEVIDSFELKVNDGTASAIAFYDVRITGAANETSQPTPSPTPSPTSEPVDPLAAALSSLNLTPADQAPGAQKIQVNDEDGDGLREVLQLANGEQLDVNGDGISDALQSDIVAIRLLNNGSSSGDYGALESQRTLVFSNTPLITLQNEESTYRIPRPDGSFVSAGLPDQISNLFSGLLDFSLQALQPNESLNVVLTLPESLFNLKARHLAYCRYSEDAGRFEEYTDTDGHPLYEVLDRNNDGAIDALQLTFTGDHPIWGQRKDGAHTKSSAGFLAMGQRRINGDASNNTLNGNLLSNRLLGRSGNDHLIGREGNDKLIGHDNHDHLQAGPGHDLLRGGHGQDRLRGGSGDDILNGGIGHDTLTGGRGKDHFRLSQGNDIIKDFSIRENDQLTFGKYIEPLFIQRGVDLVITDPSRNIHTTLLDTSKEELLSYLQSTDSSDQI